MTKFRKITRDSIHIFFLFTDIRQSIWKDANDSIQEEDTLLSCSDIHRMSPLRTTSYVLLYQIRHKDDYRNPSFMRRLDAIGLLISFLCVCVHMCVDSHHILCDICSSSGTGLSKDSSLRDALLVFRALCGLSMQSVPER